MKIVLEEKQSPHENDDYNNGLQFICFDEDVFVQVGNLSIRVDKNQLKRVLNVIG